MKKNKKNSKKILTLLIFFIILIIIYEIIHIYAVFQSEVNGDVKIENGTWKIVVNGTEVSKGVDKNFTIDKITTQNSQTVKEGKLAPRIISEALTLK